MLRFDLWAITFQIPYPLTLPSKLGQELGVFIFFLLIIGPAPFSLGVFISLLLSSGRFCCIWPFVIFVVYE